MAERKRAVKDAHRTGGVFTAEERAAIKEAVRERKGLPSAGKADGESEVRAKIAEMEPADRTMAERLHALVRAHAPGLAPRTWYGMPAYARDGQVVCFFQPAQKFKTRYATLGFSDEANLDDGRLWPVVFAITELTAAEEAQIVTLVKRAVS